MRINRRPELAISLLGFLAGCGGNNSQSSVVAPGRPESANTRSLEIGAKVLQDKPPLVALNTYLDGFHFYDGHMDRQMEAHHYCSILNEDLFQCVIFDGNEKDAKLMGVEYIVNEKTFQSLTGDEKKYWHSHVHEVRSGQLIAPGVPAAAEHALMEKIAHTYGKTWHTWHTDQHNALPLGVPTLMMGFTADGQVKSELVQNRDQRFGVDSVKIRESRSDIDYRPVETGADAWQHGQVIELQPRVNATNSEH